MEGRRSGEGAGWDDFGCGHPLPKNEYKVHLVRGILEETLTALA
jgi:hypothetical protein